MKVVYLTWGETPRSYGVFGSQVLSQYSEIAASNPNDKFFFISAVPIIHSGFLREKWRYFSEITKVKKLLGRVPFFWIPVFCSQNFINSNKATFRLMHFFSHKLLRDRLLSISPDIIHCRSYHSAWAALNVRNKYGFKYKIIFDGRGLWPEEVALKKGWHEKSANYLFLKKIEKELLSNCDISVAVSDTMNEHYAFMGAKKTDCVYLSADTQQLKSNISEFSCNSRDFTDPVRFCYVGALSEDTWHKPSMLVNLYSSLRTIFPSTHLTIVTTSDHAMLREYFSKFPDEELTLTASKTRSELKAIFTKQDFGLMTYFLPANKAQEMLGRMVLAVKTAEYLAAGLPMICSKYCGGAARLIDKFDLGAVYTPAEEESLSKEVLIPYLSYATRIRCQEFASKKFDFKVNAKKYSLLYQSIISGH